MADLTLKAQHGEAMRLMRSGDLLGSMAICRRILQAYPRDVVTYNALGQVCLQLGYHEEASNLARRVLSADPEHAIGYATLSAIYEERGLLDEALWQLERAFELSPGNHVIRRELRHLYGERSMAEPVRVYKTRAALARAYLRGRLYPKAIGELRDIVASQPHRFDLRVALAEALWHAGRYDDAEAMCRGVLPHLPNCLKANLMLGHIWLNTDRDVEARRLLQRAQALDPDNAVAQSIFGAHSALPPRLARLPFREEDAPPLDLPYLFDDETAEGVVIERSAGTIPSIEVRRELPSDGGDGLRVRLAPGAPEAVSQEAPPRAPEALPVISAPLSDAEGSDLVAEETAESTGIPDATREAAERAPSGLRAPSVPEGRRERMRSLSDDDITHLELARRFRDIGRVDQALEQYAHLTQGGQDAISIVIQDLELLNRVSPGHSALVALLTDARGRAEAFRGDIEAQAPQHADN